MVRKVFTQIVLALYVLYFLSFVTGRPAPQIERGNYSIEENSTYTELVFQPGLIHEISLLSSTLLTLDDDILENDAKPDFLFRALSRNLLSREVALGLVIFTCLFLVGTMYSNWKEQWFSKRMLFGSLLTSMAALLVILFSLRRDGLDASGAHPWVLMQCFGESLLFFLGFFVIAYESTHPRIKPKEDSILFHLYSKSKTIGEGSSEGGQILIHFAAIVLSSLIVANLLLFPIYQLQLEFPRFFALFLTIGVIGLFFFYVTQYRRVAKEQGQYSTHSMSITYLAFRVMSNSIFVLGLLALIAVTLAIVIVVSILNVEGLQTLELLKRAGTF